MSLPNQIKTTFSLLHDEVLMVHYYWKIYEQLYHSERTIELINNTAPNYFVLMQRLVVSHTYLTLSKLSDREKQNKEQTNLSLFKLLNEIKSIRSDQFVAEIESMVIGFKEECADFRSHRNKHLAHFDFEVKQGNIKLPEIEKTKIKATLKLLADIINTINKEYEEATQAYEHIISRWDADSLIERLQESERYRELKKEGVIPMHEDIYGK